MELALRITVVLAYRAAAIRTFSVTRVAALDQHDRPQRHDRPVDQGVVGALGRLHLQAERAQRGHVRLDRAGAEVAAAGVRQLEVVRPVHQRAEEHDHRARTAGGGLVDVAEVEVLGRDDLEVVVGVQPAGLHPEALEHLEQPVDLLDAGDPAQRRAAPVEQGRAEQGDAGVLGGLHLDAARSVVGPVTRRWVGPLPTATISESSASPMRASMSEGEVLVAPLDPVDRALAGAEHLRELGLGAPAMLARVPDEVADTSFVVERHASDCISDVR